MMFWSLTRNPRHPCGRALLVVFAVKELFRGTAVALTPDAIGRARYTDLEMIPMLDDDARTTEASRLLEIFLDRVVCARRRRTTWRRNIYSTTDTLARCQRRTRHFAMC